MTQGPFKILLIDDDEKFCDSFDDRVTCSHREFDLLIANNLEDAKTIFASNRNSISAVISDIDCKVSGTSRNTDRYYFSEMVRYFGVSDPKLPVFALTGFDDEYDRKKSEYRDIEVYRKGKDEERLLYEIATRLRNSALDNLKAEYLEVMNIASCHLGLLSADEMMSVLLKKDADDQPTVRGNLASLRNIFERIFVSPKFRAILPEEYTRNLVGNLDLRMRDIFYHLNGQFDKDKGKHRGAIYVRNDSALDRKLKFIYKVTSDGLHAYEDSRLDKPTRYTVTSVLYTLFDVLMWLDRYSPAS
ncbi:hypothetical protein LPW11_09935 [Geomonas sp. RF6]|uniref:hypothetical protein n=1 Tax=Geomonas sp. RF6 TaxID=2897342 RepID=UPI001E3FE1C4|nr:hypothetical protein [Geomonas sp. RF6]UFS72494.1 hypothetical protein LPW11_09935 [Geomonas sp. RF6]